MDRQRQFVKEMINEAWDGYIRYCGQRVRRTYQDSHKGWMGKDVLRNVITSMGTLWITQKKAEFQKAEDYLKLKLDVTKLDDENIISYFIADYIGGLLEVYAFTHRQWYKDKALEIAKRLKKAYESPSGLPYWKMNMKTLKPNGIIVAMSDVYNGALEYNYIYALTGDQQIKDRIERIRKLLKEREKPRGVFMRRMNVETGQFWGTQSQLSRDTKDLYFTLLKEVYMSNGEDREALDMYFEAMTNLTKPKSYVFMTSRTGQNFIQAYDPLTKKDEKTMECDSCYVGGMLAMGASMIEKQGPSVSANGESATYWQDIENLGIQWELAKNITTTCIKSHKATQTKLAPRKFCFNDTMDGTNNYWGPYDKQHHLSHEMAETLFIMWRLTKKIEYREAAWEMAESLRSNTRADTSGYSSIKRVDHIPTEKIKIQPPHFIGGTLKFLYLTFCPDTEFPLDQWVFNSSGHLFPVLGSTAFTNPTAAGAPPMD